MIDWTKPLVAGVGVPRVVAGASSDGTRYVLHADGERRWHGPDGALAGIYRPDDEYINKYRLRNVAAPEPADIEAIIADVLAAHEAGRAEDAYGKRRAYDMIGMAARSLGPIKAALAGTPPTSDANPAVPEGLRERIVAELLPGVRAILANPTYLAGAVNPPSTADLICDLAADRILALIAEQPAIVVMPLEWRHDPGNGEGLYLGGLYLGGVVPQDDERYYSASSDAACFYENFEDEDRARVELEKAVRAALKDAGR